MMPMHFLLRLGTFGFLAIASTNSLQAQFQRPVGQNAQGQGQALQGQTPQGQTPQGQTPQGQTPPQNDNPLGLGPNTPTVQIPVVPAQAAVNAGLAQAPRAQPFPELTPTEQQYLDQVLDVWEKRTATVNQFQCEFKRWQYDPNQHATAPVTIAAGVIKYSKPDKGLLRVDELLSVTSNTATNPEYLPNPKRPFGEYWICDGSWVHTLDRNEKKAVRQQLPPEMRGNQIHLSPLPFLFGVKAAEIRQRYFVRTVAPPAGNNDVWIEAWPKRGDDAGNYSRVQIVLDRADVLPKTMIVFLPNWTAEKKHREVYEFENRKQMDSLLNKMKQQLFNQDFISTKLGADWEVIEEPWVEPAANPAQPSPGLRTASPGQPATR
jgi:TIGR03009 family protein